ncbi:odorant receptor 49b-like [Culex pipiens pallens]|uniref:odorant receptor 49b-like n=1 Tax=Culex pipiens pallens TaxID=42434 RepID=UPI0022AAF4D0|nr:odorant receptor 49b-like [Culex pipiens pallens]
MVPLHQFVPQSAMKFFELQKPTAVTPFLLEFLTILGMRGGTGHTRSLRFVCLLLAGWILLGIPKAYFGFGDQLDLNIRGYSELLFLFNIDSKAIIFYMNRAKLEELVKQNGINVEEDIRLYFIHAMLIAPVHVILGLKLAATDITIFCGIKSIGSIFRLVSTRLSHLHDFKNVDELRKELKEVVDIHNDALRCVKILESISSIGVMLQLMNTVIVWVAMVFCVSYSPNMNALNLLVLLILITSQTFLLCQYGNELTEESFAVATEAYNAQWTELPVDVQKGVGLILQRAQKWEGITAARFYQVNVERFGAMVQTSYSIYVVLKDRLASKA